MRAFAVGTYSHTFCVGKNTAPRLNRTLRKVSVLSTTQTSKRGIISWRSTHATPKMARSYIGACAGWVCRWTTFLKSHSQARLLGQTACLGNRVYASARRRADARRAVVTDFSCIKPSCVPLTPGGGPLDDFSAQIMSLDVPGVQHGATFRDSARSSPPTTCNQTPRRSNESRT